MDLKTIKIFTATIAVFFLTGLVLGWFGRNKFGKQADLPVLTGETAPTLVAEICPDTTYILVPVSQNSHKTETKPPVSEILSRKSEILPLEVVPIGEKRDEAIAVTLADWNARRSYAGTLFLDKNVGDVTYSFDVQFNRAGPISYVFTPVLTSRPRNRIRPTIGGEVYANGQYAFGGGIYYGRFGVNVRAISIESHKYAIGVGVQIMF